MQFLKWWCAAILAFGADTKAIHNGTLSTQKECFQSNQDGSESCNVLEKWVSKDDIESVIESFILPS